MAFWKNQFWLSFIKQISASKFCKNENFPLEDRFFIKLTNGSYSFLQAAWHYIIGNLKPNYWKLFSYVYFVLEVVLRSQSLVKAKKKSRKLFKTLKLIFSEGQMEKILGYNISETRNWWLVPSKRRYQSQAQALFL